MTAAGPATASSGRPLGGWHDLLRPRGHWTCGERNWQGLTASDAREHELFVQFEYVTSPVHQPHDAKKERDLWVALLLRSTANIVSASTVLALGTLLGAPGSGLGAGTMAKGGISPFAHP